MHFVYFSHSYRQPDDELNKIFEQLMVSEGMAVSIDPPSDQLNSAKPERHLRSTDGMVCVLPYRDSGPSPYILYEISLAMRARRPVVVFVEDSLPSNVIPGTILGRRFSRRSLLRQVRDQRHALGIFKAYMGESPPPSYHPSVAQRSCLIVGSSCLSPEIQEELCEQITKLNYSPICTVAGTDCLAPAPQQEQGIVSASFAVAFTENLTPQEYYCFGAVRAASTPTITLTGNPNYPYNPAIPREYQPRFVDTGSAQALCDTIVNEVGIFEQDYLDLKSQEQVERYKQYKALVLKESRSEGAYHRDTRRNIVTNYNIDMSTNKVQFRDNYGNVNIDSYLENVTQVVNASPNLQPDKQRELVALVRELKAALKPIATSHSDDANRVAETLDLAVKEATKTKPNAGFLKVTAEGLKEAANAVKDIAPAVLTVAGKLVQFFLGLAV